MSQALRMALLSCISVVGLLALNGYGMIRLLEARRALSEARLGASEAAAVVEQIQSLKTRPALVAARALEAAELARRTESAAANVNIAAQAILRITPGVPRRLANTPYVQQQTQVIVKDATLRQVILLMQALDQESGLRASAVRLTAPRREDDRGTWQVELTLSYLVYSPQAANGTATAQTGENK
jgi:hypothetical protein